MLLRLCWVESSTVSCPLSNMPSKGLARTSITNVGHPLMPSWMPWRMWMLIISMEWTHCLFFVRYLSCTCWTLRIFQAQKRSLPSARIPTWTRQYSEGSARNDGIAGRKGVAQARPDSPTT